MRLEYNVPFDGLQGSRQGAAHNIVGNMAADKAISDPFSGLDNGIQTKILAITGSPEAWMASFRVTKGMVGMITRERWSWKGIFEMILELTHYESWRASTFTHYYGVELLVRHLRKRHACSRASIQAQTGMLQQQHRAPYRFVQASFAKYTEWTTKIDRCRSVDGSLQHDAPDELIRNHAYFHNGIHLDLYKRPVVYDTGLGHTFGR